MPEGPEVRITAEALCREIQDEYIESIDVTPASRYHRTGMKNKDCVAYPLRVDYVKSKGKKILFECIDDYGENVTLVSALAMEGNWKTYGGKHAGIKLNLESGRTVYFHDTRHFGTFHICLDTDELDYVMKDVGPDLLNENVSFDEYYDVISQSKLAHKEICWFMMEQKFFSGVGNYIMAEVLYDSGVMPNRKLASLSYDEISRIYENSISILQESYECGGLTIDTFFSLDGSRGSYPVKVYGRKYDPYGNVVKKATFSNGRTSHYAPAVQF